MKKVLFGMMSVIVVTSAYMRYVDDPLNSFVSFLIAGAIPGTNIMLGLWPSLVVAFIMLLLAKRFFAHIRFTMLENTSKQIVNEKLQTEFQESNDVAFDKTKRSVIAAPKANTISY